MVIGMLPIIVNKADTNMNDFLKMAKQCNPLTMVTKIDDYVYYKANTLTCINITQKQEMR